MRILKIILVVVILCALACWACFFLAHKTYDSSTESRSTFTSDGCTLFPDGNWGECRVAHDLTYWNGGSKAQRLNADRILASCIVSHTQSSILGNLVFLGVRLAGTPFLPTYWRWGFGWAYGSGYTND